MASDKPAEPVTIALGPKKKPINVTAEELFEAIFGFLRQHGIEVANTTYSGERATRDYPGETEVQFRFITENGLAWEKERYIGFALEGKCITSLSSRLGSGPFVLKMIRTRTMEEAKQGIGVKTLFDVVAQPNPDRTISFLPVKRREGTSVFF